MENAEATKDREMILSRTENFSLAKDRFDEAIRYAELIAKSDMVPDCFKGNAGAILLAWDLGQSVGLTRIQSLQSIATIGRRPTVWGDAALAIVIKYPDFNDISEEEIGDIGKAGKATCVISRKWTNGSIKTIQRTFTLDNAKKAKLIKPDKPESCWNKYPERMLQMRARSWAMRDLFPDALKGLRIYEEERDHVETRVQEIIDNQKAIDEPQPITEEGTASPWWKKLFKSKAKEEQGEMFDRGPEYKKAMDQEKPPTPEPPPKDFKPKPSPAEDYKLLGFISPEQVHRFWVWAGQKGIGTDFIQEELAKRGLATVEELPEEKAEEFCRFILETWDIKKGGKK